MLIIISSATFKADSWYIWSNTGWSGRGYVAKGAHVCISLNEINHVIYGCCKYWWRRENQLSGRRVGAFGGMMHRTLNRASLCKHYEEYRNNTHKFFVMKHNSVVYAKSGPDPNPENRKFICEMNIYGWRHRVSIFRCDDFDNFEWNYDDIIVDQLTFKMDQNVVQSWTEQTWVCSICRWWHKANSD